MNFGPFAVWECWRGWCRTGESCNSRVLRSLCQRPVNLGSQTGSNIKFKSKTGLPASLLDRLQSVLNAAARLVNSARKFDHVTPVLRDLHWLRVPERISFRLSALVYRGLHGLAPAYIARDLQPVAAINARRRLRSASTAALLVPMTRHCTIGDRAFPVAAARAWNSLPPFVTNAPSLPVFRQRLKTELFRHSFAQ